MDKFEYKVRADEIKELIGRGEYVQAAEIADTIDWRRVKSVMMLCTISDLYKINHRYEEARDMLLLAYERRPGGRTICYSLCELSIKMEEYVQAVEYYKEFIQVAPNDSGRYILQYRLYEAQEVSLEERIAVLEELKKHDYREKWAYELAYLYHRVGLASRCVEECDELILWFGEGKYVTKALELKMQHATLTEEQKAKYEKRFAQPEQEEMDIHVKTMDVSACNTINLQAELAEGVKEVLHRDSIARSIMAPMLGTDTDTMSCSEIAEASEEDLEDEPEKKTTNEEAAKGPVQMTEVFFGETTEISGVQQEILLPEEEAEGTKGVSDDTAELVMRQLREENTQGTNIQETKTPETKTPEIKTERRVVLPVEPPKSLAGVLSQESDGQLSLVMPEHENIEKQITGQICIDDILAEWERIKKINQQKREAEIREHVLQETGSMFTEFEAAVRDGLLEQLEQGKTVEAVLEVSREEPIAETDEVEELEEISEEPEAEEEAEVEEETEAEEEAEAEEETEAEEEAEAEEETEAEEAAVAEDETEAAEVVRDVAKIRALTREEKELYGPYIQSRSAREQLVKCIDNISLAAYTGNVIITGAEGMDTMTLAKNMIREIQNADSNCSGKVAKISGEALNHKDVPETIDYLKNGALIISKASEMNADTVNALYKALQRESFGIIVLMEDIKKSMEHFLAEYEQLAGCFTARMDVAPLSNDTLVAFGKQYAREREYSIDELGVLALHTRIEEQQTIDHVVTVVEIKEMIEEAIRHVKRKTLGHFMDVLLGKRYDDEDMIILSEKDFL